MCLPSEPLCFKHKLRTIQFGMVPGGARAAASTSNFDADALRNQHLLAEGDRRAKWEDTMEGMGALRWDKGQPYQRGSDGDYHALDEREMNQLLYGSDIDPDV